MATPNPDEKLTVVEGAVLPEVGVHPNTLDAALRSGALPYEWRSGRRLIRRSDLLAWAATRHRRNGFVPASPEASAS